MTKRLLIALVFCLGLFFVPAFGQDLTTKGSIGGRIVDSAGAVVANAKVTVTGDTSTTDKSATTNDQGVFEVRDLIPGRYNVKVEAPNFKTASAQSVEVLVGKTSSLSISLETGNISDVVNVSASATTIDQDSTAIGSSLNDQLYENLPLQRSVTSLFYLAPGVTDSVGGGTANPSISGGSALDNQYIADGVNITDSAFGGLGVFSRTYGTLGVGINTNYIKEVQVKTGGFEPQYGQAEGGIINIITKSGGQEYHGSVYGYFRPQGFDASRKQPDVLRVNKIGENLFTENYDTGFDFGGPVPGGKNKLFFFGSFNPSIRREIVQGAAGTGLLATSGQFDERFTTKNYAAKLDYNVTANHQFNFSIFGDPTTTNNAPFNTLVIDNTTGNTNLDFGTRNTALRYNGTLSSTWTVSASFSQGRNHFDETGFANFNQIVDRTNPVRGDFTSIGRGFVEPTKDFTYRGTFDTSKQVNFWGTHTFGLGYVYQQALYSGDRSRTGPTYTVPLTNADGSIAINPVAAGMSGENATFALRVASSSCTLCPLMAVNGQNIRVNLQQTRGEFGNPIFDTKSKYHAGYILDTYRINRFVTALVGLRYETERIIGSPDTATGNRLAFSFVDNWSPRLGVTSDPFGKGKTKLYYNFGRFTDYLPLDLAERSLSAEKDFFGGRFAPAFTTDAAGVRHVILNSFGTVTPVYDAAHLLSGAAGGTSNGITISTQASNAILPGTRLGYADEHSFGLEQEIHRDLVFSVRYIDRRLKRIIEDASLTPPEASIAGLDQLAQSYFLANISSRLDAAVNPISHVFPVGGPVPSACDPTLVVNPVTDINGNVLGAVCYEKLGKNGKLAGAQTPDGVADGFVDPIHIYKAVEIELNKRFSNSWQLLANWRISSLRGNYEGHFRNDNGQTDPGISSLFDFTPGDFKLLGDQFAVGPLNSDRRHVVNIYSSYALGDSGFLSFGRFVKGLNLGAGLHMESGLPISEFDAHPVYLNSGEVPVGGRGKLGRTPFDARLDLHADYPWKFNDRVAVRFIGDLFNVTNSQPVRLFDQNAQKTGGIPNVDFLTPTSYYLPFNFRAGIKIEF